MNIIAQYKAISFFCLAAILSTPLSAIGQTNQNNFAPLLLLDSSETSTLPKRAMADTGIIGQFNGDTLNASQLRLNLPDGRTWTVKRTRDARKSNGARTWVGEFTDIPGSLFVITQYRGLVSGFMHHGAETWEIEAAEAGRSKLYRVDESTFPPEGPLVRKAGDTSTSITSSNTAPATAASPITQDIMVVYTANAASLNGGESALVSKITSAIEAANTAYSNSQVGIFLNLVYTQQVSYSETGDMNVSLSALQSSTDGKMDEVHSLRDKYGADLVSLLTGETNYCGIAYIGSASGSASYAFSVVSPSCFAGHSFAHEIGHNQGNAHDRKNASTGGAYAYSYGYRTCDYPSLANGQDFRTVMAYSCGSSPRVNYFSNPNLYYNNAAQMGISSSTDPNNAADNAQSMNKTASMIAAYRNGPASTPPSAPSNLAGSAANYSSINLSWADNSNNETGFTLQRATGSGSFSDIASLSSNVTSFSDTGLSGSTSYSYRIRAYNSAGTSSYSNTITVTTPAAPPPPNAPTTANVTMSASTATVNWTNVAGETGYEVLREIYNSRKGTWGSSTSVSAANTTSFSTTLTSGTYRFKVRAYNGSGSSSYTIASCTGLAACNTTDGSFTYTKR